MLCHASVCLPPASLTPYIHGGSTRAKPYEIKKRSAIGNVLENTLGPWGIFWEADGNTLGTGN